MFEINLNCQPQTRRTDSLFLLFFFFINGQEHVGNAPPFNRGVPTDANFNST